MQNEVMARAIGGIDDDLILSAHSAVPRRATWRVYAACAAAALLLMFGAWQFFRGIGHVDVFLYGNRISDQAIPIEEPVVFTEPRVMENSLHIPLTMNFHGEKKVFSETGICEVYSAETGDILFSGNTVIVNDRMTVTWVLQHPDPSETYVLHIGSRTVLSLFYDDNHCQWRMIKK